MNLDEFKQKINATIESCTTPDHVKSVQRMIDNAETSAIRMELLSEEDARIMGNGFRSELFYKILNKGL